VGPVPAGGRHPGGRVTHGPTLKQSALLGFIASFIDGHGYPPTLEEMGKHFGTVSPHTGFCNVLALVRKGMLRMAPYKGRTLQLTDKGKAHAAGLREEERARRALG